MFSKTWLDAIAKKNDCKPLEINWWDTPGRDQAWKEETIRNTSKEQFRVEFECQIVGSTNTLIDPNTLTSLRSSEPIRKTEDIRIYAEPTPKHVYMLVADSARGVGGDYSAFVVIDITTMPYTISATYRDNTIKPVQFPNYIAHASQIYNDAYVLPETNDIGGQIVDMLIDELNCSNVLSTGAAGRAGVILEGEKNAINGIRTTAGVKRIGCFNLKMLIENQKLLIESDEIIEELCSFVSTKSSFAAEPGTNDDLVMCLVLFAWATSQDAFKVFGGTEMASIDKSAQRALVALHQRVVAGADRFADAAGTGQRCRLRAVQQSHAPCALDQRVAARLRIETTQLQRHLQHRLVAGGDPGNVAAGQFPRQVGGQRRAHLVGQRGDPAMTLEQGHALAALAHDQLRLVDLCRHGDRQHLERDRRGRACRCPGRRRQQGVVMDRGRGACNQQRGGRCRPQQPGVTSHGLFPCFDWSGGAGLTGGGSARRPRSRASGCPPR